MTVAEILKFAALAYLAAVGFWFGTAQAKFDKSSKANPMLFVMVALSLVTMVATLAFTITVPVPLERTLVTIATTTGAVLLIKWAFRSIRKRNLGLAFSGIVPGEVVQHGPYRHIRHPLYTAYSIYWASCAVISASPVVAVAAAGVIFVYVLAARSEERDLLGSNLGPTYSTYRRRTGLMLPKLFG